MVSVVSGDWSVEITGHLVADWVATTQPLCAPTGNGPPSAVFSPYTATGGPLLLLDAQTVNWPPGLPWWLTNSWLSPPNTNCTPEVVLAAAAPGATHAVGICAWVGVAVSGMVGVPAIT